MNAPRVNTERRAIGRDIATALRHARSACERNVKGEDMAAVLGEAAQAMAALAKIVNGDGHE